MDQSLQLLAEKYRKIFFLTDDDISLLQQAGNIISPQRNAAYSELYAWLEMQLDLQTIFSEQVLDAMYSLEKDAWHDFITANISADYVQRQRHGIRTLHALGVPFDAYLSYTVAIHNILEKVYLRSFPNDVNIVRAFHKITGIGISIVIDTFNDIANETIRAQNNALIEMSTPVTRLWNGILFLPLVGIVDSRRAQDVMSAMLQQISITSSRVFILDISGIAVLDTAVANHLIKITKATRLMGCDCIVSGISPAVAQTIVELGVHVDEINTTGNMQDALEKAFTQTNLRITNKI